MNFKSILLFLGSVIMLLLAFRYGIRAVSEPPPPKPPTEPAEWATWKVETFGDLGFTLRHVDGYPTVDGAVATRKAGPFLAMRSFPRLSILIPKTRYAGTTFLEGFVTVTAGDPVPAGADRGICDVLVKAAGTGEPLRKEAVFGGTTFTEGGVSVGNRTVIAESLVYHSWFKGRCIEITANLFSVNPRSAPRMKTFDRIDAWKQLTDIARTFKPIVR